MKEETHKRRLSEYNVVIGDAYQISWLRMQLTQITVRQWVGYNDMRSGSK